MKTLCALCVGLVIMIAPPVRAQDASLPRFINATFEQAETALLNGLQDSRPQIVTSVALTVKQLKELYPDLSFSRFIIPLMAIVKDEDATETSRIVAALALYQIHSSRGDFAITRTAQFTGNERVQHMCAWLAYYRNLEKQQTSLAATAMAPFQLISLQPPVPFEEEIVW